jgi:hypothetical protein
MSRFGKACTNLQVSTCRQYESIRRILPPVSPGANQHLRSSAKNWRTSSVRVAASKNRIHSPTHGQSVSSAVESIMRSARGGGSSQCPRGGKKNPYPSTRSPNSVVELCGGSLDLPTRRDCTDARSASGCITAFRQPSATEKKQEAQAPTCEPCTAYGYGLSSYLPPAIAPGVNSSTNPYFV